MPEATRSETWVWNASLGVYYQAASNMYALPGEGGEWAYFTAAQLASRGEGSGSGSGSGTYADTNRNKNQNKGYDHDNKAQKPRGAVSEVEEGEVEDDVGWGGLMDPDKLARVVQEDQRKKVFTPGDEDRDRDRDREREARHPAYSNGYGFDNDHDREAPQRDYRDTRQRETNELKADAPYGDRSSYAYTDDKYTDRDDPSNAARSTTPDLDPSAHILRLVVRRSKDLEHGSVAVLDGREGGVQIGRDRCEPGAPARIRVREMEVSKTHSVIYWGRGGASDSAEREDDQHKDAQDGWWIVDLGSTLGTYIAHRGERDAKRLSEAKCSSKPYPLRHQSVITVGTTTFVAHVHDDWPCGECQLAGNPQLALDDGTGSKNADEDASPAPTGPVSSRIALDADQRRGERQLKRKMELSALKATLLGDGSTGGNQAKAAYTDRSAQRRRLHGSSPPRRSATSTPPLGRSGRIISDSNAVPVGPSPASRAMLAKHGWTPGAGLGRDGAGRADPVAVVVRSERAGLGAKGEKADVGGEGDGGWKARGMRRRWDEVGR